MRYLALVVASLLLAAPAAAKPTLLVAPLKVSRTNKADAATLGRLMRVYAGQPNQYLLVTPEDMGDIDEEIKRQLSGGCDEASCIAEIGGALGAKFMITGSFDRLGANYILTLKFIDIERVAALITVALDKPTVVAIANALPDKVDELLGVKQEPEAKVSSTVDIKKGFFKRPWQPYAAAAAAVSFGGMVWLGNEAIAEHDARLPHFSG